MATPHTPVAPCGPVGPPWFQETAVSVALQCPSGVFVVADGSMSLSAPVDLCIHAVKAPSLPGIAA